MITDSTDRAPGLGPLRRHDPAALRRPHDLYRAQLRARGSVHWDDDFSAFVVLGTAEAKEALRLPHVFSSRNSRGSSAMAIEDQVRAGAIAAPNMLDLVARGYGRSADVRAGSNADPPRHTLQCGLIAPAFSPRRVRSLEAVISEVTRTVLDELAARGAAGKPVDLGIAAHRVDDYARWSEGLLKPVGRIRVEPSELTAMVQCRKEFDRYFAELIDDRLETPRDDFMTDFARGATSGATPLSRDEMLALIEQFVIAGHETTTKLLGNMLVLLAENPGLDDEVRASSDALDALIDESLRLEAPAQVVHRITVADAVLDGVAIPQHSPVMIFLGEPRPGRYDGSRLDRPDPPGQARALRVRVGHPLLRRTLARAHRGVVGHRLVAGPVRHRHRRRRQPRRVSLRAVLRDAWSDETALDSDSTGEDRMSRIAVVTGAGRGIGRATAERLASEGWQVVVSDVDAARLHDVCDAITAAGGSPTAIAADLTDADQICALAEQVDALSAGKLALVNNAAFLPSEAIAGDADLLTTDAWICDAWQVNARGTATLCRALLPQMLEAGGGSIVNIVSMLGLQPLPGRQVAYSTTKAALNMLTRHVAVTYGDRGIRCNAVAPGSILTETQLAAHIAEELAQKLTRPPSTRLGRAQDISAAVAFLLSPEARFMNGQTLSVDGGVTTQLVL